jgi:hypothetical protein
MVPIEGHGEREGLYGGRDPSWPYPDVGERESACGTAQQPDRQPERELGGGYQQRSEQRYADHERQRGVQRQFDLLDRAERRQERGDEQAYASTEGAQAEQQPREARPAPFFACLL